MCLSESNMAAVNPLAERTDAISDVLAFCPPHDFLYLASVSKTWRAVWVSTCGRGKWTAISMAASTPARTEWVVDDDSFWLSAMRQLIASSTANKNGTASFDSSSSSSSSSNDIFCVTAAVGNLVGLKVAARKLGFGGSSEDLLWSSRVNLTVRESSNLCLARRRVPEIAAEIGHLEMLKWAVSEEGCPLNPVVWFFAGKGGSLNVLEWLRGRRCPKDMYSCAAGAAAGGNLEALKWSRRRGHGWDRFVPYSAARAGDLEMLRWAAEQGCPWDRNWCAGVAAANGHGAVVEWVNSYHERS